MEGRRFVYLLFLVVLASIDGVVGVGCPDGYVEKDGTCYFFSEEKKDLQGATLDCSNMGGTLATFEDCDTESEVVSEHETEEPCTYWINPLTECVDGYSPKTELYKYICALKFAQSRCEVECNGRCSSSLNGENDCGEGFEWIGPGQVTCTCPVATDKCCKPVKGNTCGNTCGGGVCVPEKECDEPHEGAPHPWFQCPCPVGMTCCVKFIG